MQDRAPAYAHEAARFAPHYVASKKCGDAVFSATADLLGNSNEPVLNINYGVGFLSFYINEHGYTFLTDSAEVSKKGKWHDESASILDRRTVSATEVRVIAENEIRDANTLGICATLAARGVLSLAPR